MSFETTSGNDATSKRRTRRRPKAGTPWARDCADQSSTGRSSGADGRSMAETALTVWKPVGNTPCTAAAAQGPASQTPACRSQAGVSWRRLSAVLHPPAGTRRLPCPAVQRATPPRASRKAGGTEDGA
jgi:hypothetical protein